MAKDKIAQLKSLLRHEVTLFYRRDRRLWSEPIVKAIRELQVSGSPAVFFGGTLRSLLISRLKYRRAGDPRDIDIVVRGAPIDVLRKRLHESMSREIRFGRLSESMPRETRFGGLHLQGIQWQFDVWPLERTWAFIHDETNAPEFSDLPRTTFFNLEAIAVDVWPRPGRPRAIYSGDDQFFHGVINGLLELNREENPYPGLGIVRALLLAASIDFRLGPRLSQYVANIGTRMGSDELEDIQAKHYGKVLQPGSTLLGWIRSVSDAVSRKGNKPISLPLPRQLPLLLEDLATPRVHLRFLRNG